MQAPLLSPVDAYDALAPSYASLASVRQPYCRTINDIVVSRAREAKAMLDVGAGDGVRAMEIGRALGVKRLVLLEPSPGMRARVPEGAEVWPFGFEEIPDGAGPFELITCLWNVLGHVQGTSHRINGLVRLRQSLTPQGTIFLDVIHRYNASAYGWGRTVARVLHDALVRSESNGDVTVSWKAGDRTIQTRSHVFTGSEMQALFHAAGLVPLRRWVIGYDTGAVCRLPFSGHLLYQVAST